jgi:tRNA A-37 threonylcarbamoyl transferase component Bud32
MDVEVGQVLNGKYRIVRRIGAGGMATVYEASHTGLGTPLAVKVLLPELARVPTLADRFRREARVSATLKSPHVIQVTDVDQLADGRPYLVMELLSGESLEERLVELQALSRERAVDIGVQILAGLECAHALGVIHRDLKPGNVFLARQGTEAVAKLLDFGIAKVKASTEFQNLTRPGMVMGTPEYMAPEQAFSSDQASVQSDLYSVGVMLYEMLSGKLPAEGDLPLVVAQQILTGKVRPLHELCPGLPQGLVNLVQRALQADPAARPESALAMRRELSAFAGALSAAGRLASAVPPVGIAPAGLAPGGTEKVPAVPASAVLAAPVAVASGSGAPAAVAPAVVPAQPGPMTAEMSSFRAVPAAAGAVPRAPLPRTAEMPRAAALPATIPTPQRPPPPDSPAPVVAPARARRRGSVLLWITLCGLLLGAGVGALWLLQVMNDPGPPPPMPLPRGYRPGP